MRACRRLALATGFAVLPALRALAFLQTGTLLTNAATVTYSVGTQGTSITYSATMRILIANPDLYLWKNQAPTAVSASGGGIVTFSICFSNGGANTAFNVVITDHLPQNVYWYDPTCSAPSYVITGSVPGANIFLSYATALAGPWSAGCPATGTSAYFVRWTVSRVDVGKSGCVAFAASVY